MTDQPLKLPPIQLNVQNITNCSGIFISDTNVTYGWATHSKQNIGFGRIGTANLVQNNVSLTFDSDYIDTIIDDRDIHSFIQNRNAEPSAQFIGFERINVNSVQQNSGVFVGQSNLNGLDQHQKQNIGQGTIYGSSNLATGNHNVVYDPDVIDGVMNDQDQKQGVFVNT